MVFLYFSCIALEYSVGSMPHFFSLSTMKPVFIHSLVVTSSIACRELLPALNNNLINLLKTTTLAYAIAVPETLYAVKQIWSESQNVLEMMLVLLATYAVLVGGLVWIMHRWERALRIPGYSR